LSEQKLTKNIFTMKKIYILLLTLTISSLSFGQIIITEVADPQNNANGRFVEIYNISNSSVNLESWELKRWTNQNEAVTASSAISLTSLDALEPGEFAVIAKSAFQGIYGFAPDIVSSASSVDSNGDDQLAIFDSSGNIIDIFGVPGEDGTNTCHEFEDGRAERKASVTSSQNTWDEAEWNVWGTTSAPTCTSHFNATKQAPDGFDPGSWIGASSDDVTISIGSPANDNVFEPGTTSTDLQWTTTNTSGSETVDVIVNGTTTNNATSPFVISTADGQTYAVTVNLVDNGVTIATDTTNFSVASITQAIDLSVVRAGTVGDYFELSNEVLLSYIVTEGGNGSYRNQKYIQDAEGGILIDDTAGILSTTFNVGDGLTGLKGRLNAYSGTLQLIPFENITTASSTANTITPEVVTLAEFLTNGENYESELIKIENVTFSDSGVFEDNSNYVINSGSNASVLRTSFGNENLIGANIPTTAGFVIGLGAEFNGNRQITPRYLSDIENATLGVVKLNTITFNLYPNPAKSGFVNITSTGSEAIQATVFDILGKKVINVAVTNERLNVSTLNAGIYIVKLTQGAATTTKKLIIQ